MRQGGVQLAVRVLCACCLGVAMATAWAGDEAVVEAIAETGNFESEPTLAAADLVIPALLNGPGYRVRPSATVHGFQASFVIETRWGELRAESVELLAIRVSEIPALEALYSESVTEALVKSGAMAVAAPVRAVVNVAREPETTLRGLPGGIWRFFSERAIKLAQQAKRLGSRADQRISHDGSPYDAADAPLTATRRPETEEDSWFGNLSEEVGRLAKSELGFGAAKRALAARLGVDPYSGNPLLRERLDRLAWSATVGKLGIGQAMSLLDPLVSATLDTASTVNRVVLELPPEDLRRRNDEALAPHCVDGELRYQFLNFARFSPTLQTELTDRIAEMDLSAGCSDVLETALMAQNEVEARYVVNTLKLTQAYLGERVAGGRWMGLGAVLSFETADGERILPLPVDLLSWTADTARWFGQQALWSHPQRSVISNGQISVAAQRALTKAGWSLLTGLSYSGSPPYLRTLEMAPVR